MIDFEIQEINESVSVVKLSGALNEVTRDYFFDCIGDMLDGPCSRIVVDCSGLGTLGSSGLASLLRARKQASKKGGRVYLTHVESTLANALEQTGLSRLFAIHPSTDGLVEQLLQGELAHA